MKSLSLDFLCRGWAVDKPRVPSREIRMAFLVSLGPLVLEIFYGETFPLSF